jgi:hypothetical protein
MHDEEYYEESIADLLGERESLRAWCEQLEREKRELQRRLELAYHVIALLVQEGRTDEEEADGINDRHTRE